MNQSNTTSQTSKKPTEPSHQNAINEIKKLMENEPTNVQESLIKEFKEIDSIIEKMNSTLSEPGTDQAFKEINLLPDHFEAQMSDFVKTFQKFDID